MRRRSEDILDKSGLRIRKAKLQSFDYEVCAEGTSFDSKGVDARSKGKGRRIRKLVQHRKEEQKTMSSLWNL